MNKFKSEIRDINLREKEIINQYPRPGNILNKIYLEANRVNQDNTHGHFRVLDHPRTINSSQRMSHKAGLGIIMFVQHPLGGGRKTIKFRSVSILINSLSNILTFPPLSQNLTSQPPCLQQAVSWTRAATQQERRVYRQHLLTEEVCT